MWLLTLTAFATNAATTTAEITNETIIFLPLMGNVFPQFINMLSFNYKCKVREKNTIQQKIRRRTLPFWPFIMLYQAD